MQYLRCFCKFHQQPTCRTEKGTCKSLKEIQLELSACRVIIRLRLTERVSTGNSLYRTGDRYRLPNGYRKDVFENRKNWFSLFLVYWDLKNQIRNKIKRQENCRYDLKSGSHKITANVQGFLLC